MSLKITIEVDGQTEQQLAPVIGQFVARHPQGLGIGANASEVNQPLSLAHDNPALLQQQIQQLTAQNQLLQAQVNHSQRLLAGVLPAALLSQAADSQQAVTASALTVSPSETPPLLPVRYQSDTRLRYRLRRSLVGLPKRLWQALLWLALGREWLWLFLLLCGGMYGTLSLAPRLADHLWPPPEFVDSAGDTPGETVTPEPAPEQPEEKAPNPAPPASPTSKAGSHPPPPPAFQQP
jgi:hypothetical protein